MLSTGELLADFSIELSKRIVDEAATTVRAKKYSVANVLGVSINKYATKIYKSCSKTKTLLYSDKAVDIKNIYINGVLSSQGLLIKDDLLLQEAIKGDKQVLISGTAGSGKSMMMKHFLLQSIRTQNQALPVFFELRNINKSPTENLIDLLFKRLELDAKQFPRKRFDDCLNRGMFIFILDGFDEIDEDLTDKVEAELRDLYQRYSKNSFIISTRPDVKLSSSTAFEVYHVQPITLVQAVSLIEKVKYDTAIKDKFIEDLKGGLYKKHIDFASSPLLLTMMLMTFNSFAVISEKIHLFYNQVFEVLFLKHDISKDGYYQRSTKTSLPIDDFSELLQFFSSSSYAKKDFEFSQPLALSYAEKAVRYCGHEVDKRHFLQDLLKAVCILIKDGNIIRFTHRSFQEYFTALFASNLSEAHFVQFVIAIESRITVDDVLFLLFGMQRERLERLILIEYVESFLSQITENNKSTDANLNMINALYTGVAYGMEDSDRSVDVMIDNSLNFGSTSPKTKMTFAFEPKGVMPKLIFLIRCYPAEFEWLGGKQNGAPSSVHRNDDFFFAQFLGKHLPKLNVGETWYADGISTHLSKSRNSIGKNLIKTLEQIKKGILQRNGDKETAFFESIG